MEPSQGQGGFFFLPKNDTLTRLKERMSSGLITSPGAEKRYPDF
jgi:hypothetical protein